MPIILLVFHHPCVGDSRESGRFEIYRVAKRTGILMRCGLTLYLLKQEMVHWSYEVRHCTPDGGRSLVELCVDLYRSGKWS
jgi:hypothetical protein